MAAKLTTNDLKASLFSSLSATAIGLIVSLIYRIPARLEDEFNMVLITEDEEEIKQSRLLFFVFCFLLMFERKRNKTKTETIQNISRLACTVAGAQSTNGAKRCLLIFCFCFFH